MEVLKLFLRSPIFLSSCGLFEIHYPLSFPVISFSLSPPSPPFYPTQVPCQIWRILKGNITVTKGLSLPRLIPYGVRWRVRLQLLCSPREQCGNTTPFALRSPSLRWAQPARTKNFDSPGFNRASSHAFSISSTPFQQQKNSEIWKAYKKMFHLIPCLQNPCCNLPLSSCLFLLIQLFLFCL